MEYISSVSTKTCSLLTGTPRSPEQLCDFRLNWLPVIERNLTTAIRHVGLGRHNSILSFQATPWLSWDAGTIWTTLLSSPRIWRLPSLCWRDPQSYPPYWRELFSPCRPRTPPSVSSPISLSSMLSTFHIKGFLRNSHRTLK